jgi:clan AA aspartic protease
MITGNVNTDQEAVLPLQVRGPTGRTLAIEAVIDTGFTHWWTLPFDQINLLQLAWEGRGQGDLADGTELPVDVYQAEIFWDQHPRRIYVAELGTVPLVGMKLLEDHCLTIDVIDGGRVEIAPLTTDH